MTTMTGLRYMVSESVPGGLSPEPRSFDNFTDALDHLRRLAYAHARKVGHSEDAAQSIVDHEVRYGLDELRREAGGDGWQRGEAFPGSDEGTVLYFVIYVDKHRTGDDRGFAMFIGQPPA